ncbi:cadmium/zinc-transporting ATPase hma2 [Phtheirospermum japonicum]|uniref:Cadmium/zinc-transporting ATPase hma2 n=1 Tax=Phtheirospermum japonicum TaxID=374723 RepID=A0A830BT50_9LAMI|nr:cadmium/zinc-transporting ATPase hma2 [Phtheirospermum japonicum]
MEAIDKNVAKKFQKSYFDVLGLCCSSEIPLIEKIIKSLDGVKDFSIVVTTKTLVVVHDPLLISQIQIVKALNQARLEANIRVYGATNYKNKWPSPYAVASGTLLLLSFLKYVYGPLRWLAVGAIVVGVPPILLKAVTAIRNLRLDINILVLITVAGSIALHDYWEAATIVFLFTISEWLESRASHKATAVMSSLVSVVPQKAILVETGEEINVDDVKLNSVIAVKAGETIPIDGVVVEGNCEVDEKILTGESFPVAKQKDSTVWASTINLNGYVCVKTTVVAEDCVVARMAKIVEEAQNKKSRTQRFMDKCAKYYTPAIVVASALLALVPLAFKVHNKNEWYHLALVVLVSGCPCALLLSTPVAMFCALSKAATLGVLFKGAEHLETLARIKIMAFDKTGTITRGEFLVEDFKSLRNDIDLNALLYWISSVECKSSHPMAAALVEFARSHGIEPKPDRVENFQNFPGGGICGIIEDNEIYIGNSKIASRAGCTEVPKLEGYDVEGKSVGYVFLGSSPAGIFCLSDICRTGAKEAIEELKSIGIKTVMLTGDCHGAAKRAQEQLGGALDVIHADLLPEDKARIIKELQNENPTAMIGDGLNDAPALATADIGISMGVSGSALATESGDVVLMSNDIQRIAQAFRIAKKVWRKIIENVIISVSTKVAILVLAVAGHPLVWAAVLADVGTCLVVIFNSMLLLKGRPKKCCESKNHSHNKSAKNHDHDAHCHPHDEKHGMQKSCDHHDHDHDHDHNTACKGSLQSSVSDELATTKDHCMENECTNRKDGEQSSMTLDDHGVKHIKACLASRKRCCESYRRECCIRNTGHFETHGIEEVGDAKARENTSKITTWSHCLISRRFSKLRDQRRNLSSRRQRMWWHIKNIDERAWRTILVGWEKSRVIDGEELLRIVNHQRMHRTHSKGCVGTQSVKRSRLTMLTSTFEAMRMDEKESIMNYAMRLSNIANECGELGEVVTNSCLLGKILRSITRKFSIKVVVIEESKDTDDIEFNALAGSLKTFEIEHLDSKSKEKNVALSSDVNSEKDEDGENFDLKGVLKKMESTTLEKEEVSYVTQRFNNFLKKKNNIG